MTRAIRCEIFPETDHTRNQFVTITERHVFSATLVNALHVGFVRNNENSQAQGSLTSAQLTAANAFMSALGGPAIASDPLVFVPVTPDPLPAPGRPDDAASRRS